MSSDATHTPEPLLSTPKSDEPLESLTRDLKPSVDGDRHELTEIGACIRHYSALRFAIFTVFFAFIGGAVNLVFDPPGQDLFLAAAARSGGLAGTLVFWFFEYRIAQGLLELEVRAAEIEARLGYRTYGGRPRKRPYTSQVTGPFYFLVVVFWVLAIYR